MKILCSSVLPKQIRCIILEENGMIIKGPQSESGGDTPPGANESATIHTMKISFT
jgi:hypothetical protein